MAEQSTKLEERVEFELDSQKFRIQIMTETFKEALRLSNKTYFLEQVDKLKNEKTQMKKKMDVIEEKLKIQDQVMEKSDLRNWELFL